MRNGLIVFAATAVLMSATAICAEEFNPVLGKVSDFSFREADLDRMLAAQPPEVQKKFQEDPQLRVNLVREILTKKAVMLKARKDGFEKKPEIKEQLSYLIDNYISQEYLIKVVTANVSVPEEAAKKFYQEHEKDFVVPEQIKVRHILLEATKETGAEDRAKARSKAEAALQRLKNGEDFAKVAKEMSEDQNSAGKGGELGIITSGKTNSDEFEKAAFALKQGVISDVVTTAYGFHIIRVDERQEKRTAGYDEVKNYILKNLKQEEEQKRVQDFVEKATQDSGLEVFTEKITGVKEETAKKAESAKKEPAK